MAARDVAVDAGADQREAVQIFQVRLLKVDRLFFGDAALVAAQEFAVAIHQGDHRVAVFTLLHTAVGGVDAQFPGGGLYQLCGLVAAKDAHVGGGSSQHGSVSGEVEGVSARIHCFGMHVFIDNIVAHTDDPDCHMNTPL